ncbi:hypothetical protein A9199_12415 [Donghicola sp. JL3646]|nr:hypothetical protein BSK21_15460 [Marivivens sp. JLT3646]OBR39362.1 hypothetical protein A9199_12415 [Donghicola sp. JL3646]
MRILHVYQVYLPDDFTGIPRVIWDLCEGMGDFGVESEVLCLTNVPPRNSIRFGNHLVHYARRDVTLASASLSLDVFFKFRKLIDKYDIIHYHYPWPVGDVLHLVFGRKKPSLITYHSDIVKQKFLRKLYSPIEALFLGSVNKIVSTSPNYSLSSKNLMKFKDKVSVIPIGLPDRTMPNSENFEKWQSRVGTGFFLFVGSLRYYKGLSFLIDAARETGLPVVIAGRGSLPEINLPKNVKYVGEVSDDDKECLLSLCRAFVFPSHLRSEAFGVALLEAARAGRPMISCEIGTGTSFVNLQNQTGYVITPKNVPHLVNAMRLLAASDKDCERFGKNAVARYQKLFTASQMCKTYNQIYQGLRF